MIATSIILFVMAIVNVYFCVMGLKLKQYPLSVGNGLMAIIMAMGCYAHFIVYNLKVILGG